MSSMRRARPAAAVLALVAVLVASSADARGRGAGQRDPLPFSAADLLDIAHPSAPVWSPDGRRIAFLRELDGAVDLWWTSEERDEPVAVTEEVEREPPRSVDGFAWSADAEALVYALRGDLYLYRIENGDSIPLTDNDAIETDPVLGPGGNRIAFVRDGDVWVGSFPELEGGIVAARDQAFHTLLWSPDGRYLAAGFGRSETGLALIDVDGGVVHTLEDGPAYAGEPAFSTSGTLAWQEVSADAKRRRILVAAPPDWTPRVVVSESDDAWWTLTYLQAGPRWSPVDERLVFLSERDGWTHAWLLDLARPDPTPVQLTAGEFEVEAPAWSPDGTRLLLSANRGSSSERGLQLLDVPDGGGALPELEPISRLCGTSIAPRWRPDGELIAFLHADPENPLDLWVQEPGPNEARQLTDSWPEDLDEEELVRPQRARFSSADGTLVPAQLFLPPDHRAIEGPIPALVWVHGGGIRQNRYGWHPRRAYAVFYGFHQYLLQRGYALVTVDYRGSIGYGRAFRQGQYRDLGGRDLDDVLGAIRYLRRIEEVEIGRIGVWGISYGGYLTLQALVQAPTAFDAGVDVAGVADWADWALDPGGLWIEGRMGPVQDNAAAYRRRSPIHAIERLARPLLILHGSADRNVPVLQSFELTDALVRAGKPFDLMIYPGEQHAFVRTHTWRDAFRRVEAFFDAHLR